MKKSELRQIIKEEIRNILSERFDIKKMDLPSFKNWEGVAYRIESVTSDEVYGLLKAPNNLNFTRLEKIVKRGFGPHTTISSATPDDLSNAKNYHYYWRIS